MNTEVLEPALYIIGTPIGNLSDTTLRSIEILKNIDVLYCEDTRRTLKLLNHFEIKKVLKQCPHFKEKNVAAEISERIKAGESVGLVSDAGMPGISDPGQFLVSYIREAGQRVHIIGGVSSLTYFISGLGRELESFKFIGFLPPRAKDRTEIFKQRSNSSLVFMESPHRIESTLDLLIQSLPETTIILAKELSKVSENFFVGTPESVKKQITSFKGEWMGCIVQ